ncbi:alpha/beta hydrolase-fold protein [Musicola paradisiaca]|uniref:Alpha/beta hydrolase n=1 Tax=Musicola paradisiaca (strain Ech703) TaxID=579405 RepID=C6CBK1_MUSP7|nr:hypothetical protein [Musicola paradisiaca]ACS84786.1 hypothetical protein Dd703_0980 [Musicola paradisiaca Ech703]
MKIPVTILFLLLFLSNTLLAATLPPGRGDMTFPLPGTGKTITVFSYAPAQVTPQTPVVFVLTGVKRNAGDYRDAWQKSAEKNHLLVLVPAFTTQDYPGVNGYNLGNLVDAATGLPNPRAQWSYSVIETLFDALRQQGVTQQSRYYLFGNSAGCQFVHRMLTLVPEAHVKAAVCAAAGWWTLTDDKVAWPYGLAHAPVARTADDLAPLFALPLLVAVGQHDNNPAHPLLRRTAHAMAQGDNRLARARNYYAVARQQAQRRHEPFNWQLSIVPHVGHSGSKMSVWAASQLAHYERNGTFDIRAAEASTSPTRNTP